jgi:plastocyanin
VPAASGSAKPKPKPVIKLVKVIDDYYSRSKLTIKKGNEIKWVWAASNFDTHNVTLIKAPKGVNHGKFSSIDGTGGIHFTRTFTKPGTYHFECTIHPETMFMTVTVKG